MAESMPTDQPPADQPRAKDASAEIPSAEHPAAETVTDEPIPDETIAGEPIAAEDSGAPSGESRPIGFWLKLVDNLIDERFASTLDEHGVTRRQWQLLSLLRRGPASREELEVSVAPFTAAVVTDADEALGASTLAELDELIESEWVSDSPTGFVLLPKGEQSFERLNELVSGIRSTVASGIEDAAYSTTVRTLEQMARNLGWHSG